MGGHFTKRVADGGSAAKTIGGQRRWGVSHKINVPRVPDGGSVRRTRKTPRGQPENKSHPFPDGGSSPKTIGPRRGWVRFDQRWPRAPQLSKLGRTDRTTWDDRGALSHSSFAEVRRRWRNGRGSDEGLVMG